MTTATLHGHRAFLIISFVVALTGCATSQNNNAPAAEAQTVTEEDIDPIEPANRVFYDVNETLDSFLVKPVAEVYAMATPAPVRESVGNFFANLTYINVILNSFLQAKFDQGWSDTSRFLINSTLGVGGLFDVASDMGFARHEEDLGQTLAVWGSGQGAYLYLPVLGPNTVRDTPDIASSLLTNPLFYVSGTVLYPVTALGIISKRAELLDATRMRDEAAMDPYIFTREAYLQRRNYLIYDGNPPLEGYDDIFDVDTGGQAEDEPPVD